MKIDALVRDNVINMSSYSSARDEYKNVTDENLIYLDANESPFDNGINRYPNNKHNDLKTVETMAQAEGLQAHKNAVSIRVKDLKS